MDHTRTDISRIIDFVYRKTKFGWTFDMIRNYINQNPYEFAER